MSNFLHCLFRNLFFYIFYFKFFVLCTVNCSCILFYIVCLWLLISIKNDVHCVIIAIMWTIISLFIFPCYCHSLMQHFIHKLLFYALYYYPISFHHYESCVQFVYTPNKLLYFILNETNAPRSSIVLAIIQKKGKFLK